MFEEFRDDCITLSPCAVISTVWKATYTKSIVAYYWYW